MAQLRGIFEDQGRASVRRNLNNLHLSPGQQHQQSTPGNTLNGPPGEQAGLQHQAAGGAPPPNQTPTQPTLPSPHNPLLPTLPAEAPVKKPTPTSLLTGMPIEVPPNPEDDDFSGLPTQETVQADKSDIETHTPLLSFTPATEDNELEDIFTKMTPKGDQLAALQDTASKIALPAKSSRLPAARKKSMSVSNFEVSNLGESSDIDDEGDDAKKSRKDRMAKNNTGR